VRQERFALLLARGLNQTDAYEAAGFKRSGASASKAARKPGVAARVREMQNHAAHRCRVTLASLIEKAEDARELAMFLGQPAAAIAAIKEIGVLTGLRVEKRDDTVRTVDDLSDEELIRIARGETPPLLEERVWEEPLLPSPLSR
jgi:phage terminase small subunit